LALSVFINYVGRGNLSVAAPLLKAELRLSAYHLGLLLGPFFCLLRRFLLSPDEAGGEQMSYWRSLRGLE
jgi:hypothetical protein